MAGLATSGAGAGAIAAVSTGFTGAAEATVLAGAFLVVTAAVDFLTVEEAEYVFGLAVAAVAVFAFAVEAVAVVFALACVEVDVFVLVCADTAKEAKHTKPVKVSERMPCKKVEFFIIVIFRKG
ncbi:hypothetical protein [Rufibacter roseolus]|uniref:hypothetical protein n=1 Tax=Rufibacter roseolus TaxID=2817375 RepID=UPI001B3058B9|nr:hypothetical protein [Rufibacter roseolus]